MSAGPGESRSRGRGRAASPGESAHAGSPSRISGSRRGCAAVRALRRMVFVDFGLDDVDLWGEFDGDAKYTDPATARRGRRGDAAALLAETDARLDAGERPSRSVIAVGARAHRAVPRPCARGSSFRVRDALTPSAARGPCRAALPPASGCGNSRLAEPITMRHHAHVEARRVDIGSCEGRLDAREPRPPPARGRRLRDLEPPRPRRAAPATRRADIGSHESVRESRQTHRGPASQCGVARRGAARGRARAGGPSCRGPDTTYT